MRVKKSRQAASAQRARLRAARRSRARLEREQLDVIVSTYWHRYWQRPEVKPGTRVRVPRGVLHASRIGLTGQQYLCGRPARGRIVASAWGVELPRALLCRRCLRMVLEEAECGE